MLMKAVMRATIKKQQERIAQLEAELDENDLRQENYCLRSAIDALRKVQNRLLEQLGEVRAEWYAMVRKVAELEIKKHKLINEMEVIGDALLEVLPERDAMRTFIVMQGLEDEYKMMFFQMIASKFSPHGENE